LISTRGLTALGDDFRGYALVDQSGSQALAVEWIQASRRGRRHQALTAVSSSALAAKWVCADVYRVTSAPREITTLDVLHDSTSDQNVKVTFYDSAGAGVYTQTTSVAGDARATFALAGSAFDMVGDFYRGVATVESLGGTSIAVVASGRYGASRAAAYTCAAIP
jgi:hypothetical protein